MLVALYQACNGQAAKQFCDLYFHVLYQFDYILRIHFTNLAVAVVHINYFGGFRSPNFKVDTWVKVGALRSFFY